MTETCVASTALSAAWAGWVLLLTLAVFDFGTAVLLRWTLQKVEPAALVREKGVASRAGGEAGGEETSYSRVAGVVGSVVIACFFWAFGNILIWRAFADPSGQSLKALVDGVWPWLTGGAAMFLPYAVNQLRAAFTR